MNVEMRFLPTHLRRSGPFQKAATQIFESVMTTLGGCPIVVFSWWGHQSVEGSDQRLTGHTGHLKGSGHHPVALTGVVETSPLQLEFFVDDHTGWSTVCCQ